MQSVQRSLDAEGVAAAFLGGTEKIREGTDYGVPLVEDKDPVSAVQKALAEYEVDVVVDLSDEPVIGYRERMKIASLALYAGARYLGSDFELKPPDLRPVSTKPSLAVIGTGKRVGKTAISGYLARLLAAEGFDPGVVSMGRGGPQFPEVIEGHKMEVGSEYLLEALGRGLAGEPFISNVLEGAEIANGLDTRVTLFDGSGAAMPPVQVERRVLVAGANQDPEYIVGFLGTYRLLLSDLVLLTMSEEPMADSEKVRGLVAAVRKVRPDLIVIPTVFRPRPVGKVEGLRVGYVSTAPPAVLDTLSRHLEVRYGCEVVAASGNLSDRKRLWTDLEEMSGVEASLTEIKAAAVDVVTRRGSAEGKPVFYCDNDPVGENLDKELLGLAREAVANRAP